MKKVIYFVIKYVILVVFAIIILFPIITVINSSFKTEGELYKNIFGVPEKLQYINYIKAWVDGMLYIYYKNTFIVTIFGVTIIILLSTMAAFALTRRNLKFRSALYILFIAGITIPVQVSLIPLYLQLNRLMLSDSLIGLVFVYAAYLMPFSVFIAYGFFKTIPKEIEESATIDGCNNLAIYLSIYIPLSRSAIVTILIFNLVYVWNDMLFPLVIITSNKLKTLPIGLLKFRGEFISQYTLMFAAVVIVSMPITIIYLLLQKQFMQGLTAGAIKG